MSKINLALVVLVLLSTYPPAATVDANERPLVDAGLDQRVRKGATVLLDGTGSRDPDGAIREFEWTIEAPSGRSRSPADPDAARTRFSPTELGRYAVTLTVTDDDGATSNDTLYVTVSPGRAPSVELSGPRSREVGETGRYTARIDAGDADLDHVVWTVDGTTVANRTLSGTRATDDLARVFPTDGTHLIRAAVYDVDGQRDSASVSVSVERPSPGGSAGSSDIADTVDPTIRGPRLVTGARPLTGTYSLRTSGASARIEGITWRTRTGTVSRGPRTTIDWSPGTHRLFALVTYADGSSDVARFSDGGMTVRADPKPDVEIGDLDTFGGISGSPVATDGYGNLRSLRVMVDGDVVAESTIDPAESRRAGGRRQQRPFDDTDVAFGREHEVTVVATDTRGQITTETTTVKPVGKPEIVRSEFVNGPVDSYHRRIDVSRYAAHHVLEIDLNGADPEDVMTKVTATSSTHTRQLTDHPDTGRTYYSERDSLVLHTYWAGNYRYNHAVNAQWKFEDSSKNLDWDGKRRSTFQVGPSDPELRYEVISDGTVHDKTDWGIVVDASRSFDPDHTDLKYRWKGGARPISEDNATAKFDSWQFADLKLVDGNNGTTRNQYNFLNFYNPGIREVSPTSEKAYKPNETVRFKLATNPYKLTKNRYDIALGLEIDGARYSLTDWDVLKVGEDCQIGNCGLSNITEWMQDIDNHRFSVFHGTVEIKASELADGTSDPEVVLYNEGSPERTRVVERLPEVNVLTRASRVWENVSVTDLEYTIERPTIKSAVTMDVATRDEHLRKGYSIERTETVTKYPLEKYVQTQEAEYGTETRSFGSRQFRKLFLAEHPEWSVGDHSTSTETWTTTETEWRDSKSGTGEFTGRTRRHQTDSADYRVKRQFEYDYRVEKTNTRTVWHTKRIRVRKTGTRTVTNCYAHFGCHETTETYSYWDTETYRVPRTETYTYTVTRTKRYWSFGKWGSDHRPTGRTRRIKVDGADYTTQYEYRYQAEHSRTIHHFEISRRVQTQEAQYEWLVRDEVASRGMARTLTQSRDHWRIGDTESATQWTLTKRDGTERRVASSYQNPSYVVETRATVSGDAKQRYLDTETGSIVVEPLGSRRTRYESDDAETKREVGDHFTAARLSDPSSDRDLQDEFRDLRGG